MNIFEKIAKLIAEGKSDEANKLLTDHMASEVEGLKTKNSELLGKLKDQSKVNTDLTARLEALETEKNGKDEEVLKKAGEFDKLREQIEKRHKDEIAKLSGERDKLNGQLKTHVIGEGLTAALVKAKVAPHMMDAVKALILSNYQGEIAEKDGKPFASFDGKAVDEFVTGWAQSDAGKHFIAADSNSGGGSNGANGNGKAGTGGQKTMTKAAFSQLSPADKMKVSKEGVTLTE